MQHALTRAQPELDADGLAVWQQLGRLAGPGERQAAALALLLWPGNDAERRAWDETVRGVQGAASLRDRIGRLPPAARLPRWNGCCCGSRWSSRWRIARRCCSRRGG